MTAVHATELSIITRKGKILKRFAHLAEMSNSESDDDDKISLLSTDGSEYNNSIASSDNSFLKWKVKSLLLLCL